MADEETDVPELEADAPEIPEIEDAPERPEAAEGEGDEFAIEIEGEEPADEPDLVKKLRGEIRDRDRRLAEHEKAAVPKVDLGPKPKLDDFWSEESPEAAFEEALDTWKERERAAKDAQADAERAREAQTQTYQRRFQDYRAQAAALPVKDFDEIEKAVIAALPESPDRPFQQALLTYAKDPAKLVYALGKHPAKLAALAEEKDPIRFILAISEMERNLKVTTRKKPPEPEAGTILRGSAGAQPSSDKQAAKLLAKAQETGNMDEYRAYMKGKRKAA